MRKKPTRKRPYFTMESAMTAILRDGSGKMHHGILFDPPLVLGHEFTLGPSPETVGAKRAFCPC